MTKAIFTPAIDCTNEQRPFIKLNLIESNKLHAVGYCATSQTFAATFAPGGAIYHYEGFTPEQFAAFNAAESKGRHFGQFIQTLPSKKYGPEAIAEPTAEVRPGELHTEDPDHGDDVATSATAAELEAAGQERLIA